MRPFYAGALGWGKIGIQSLVKSICSQAYQAIAQEWDTLRSVIAREWDTPHSAIAREWDTLHSVIAREWDTLHSVLEYPRDENFF